MHRSEDHATKPPNRPRVAPKQDIRDRFGERRQAEHYRDRYVKGKRQRTHQREASALALLLQRFGLMRFILDVASGHGRFARLLSEHTGRLIQLDASRHMLDLSREDHPLPSDRSGYVQADAGRLPLADDSVELVFCHRFLNHVPDPAIRRTILRELARVSRGYVIVSCLNAHVLIRAIRRLYARVTHAPADQSITVGELLDSAKEAGLTLVSRTPIRRLGRTAAYLSFRKAGGMI